MVPVDARASSTDMAEAGGGSLGTHDRGFRRKYSNYAEGTITDHSEFISAFSSLRNGNQLDPFGRHVIRALMTRDAVRGLVQGQKDIFPGIIEFALPVTVSGEKIFFVGAGVNGPERQASDPDDIRGEVLVYQRPPKTLAQHRQHVADTRHRVITTIDNPLQRETLAAHWYDTFGGWTVDGVTGLAMALEKQTSPDFPQSQRSVVFTGIVDESDNIDAAVIGGALKFPTSENTPPFILWESTEWIGLSEVGGLVSAAAAINNEQIIAGFHGVKDYSIIAEVNTATPAPGVARSAAMTMPKVRTGEHEHHQILRNNVGVRDGRPAQVWMEEGGMPFPLRNFGVVQLSKKATEEFYLPFMPGIN